jgi:hypothetical protein
MIQSALGSRWTHYTIEFKLSALKFYGPLAVAAGDRRLYPPRTVFSGMENLPGIVGFQADLQILGKSDVERFRLDLAPQNINVGKFHSLSHGGQVPPSFVYRGQG